MQDSSQAPSKVPTHMYPVPQVPAQIVPRSKRKQVKHACTNCQKACKKCDDARPCMRCVKYGIAEECVDSQRKERRKGTKRGPYRKRESVPGGFADQLELLPQQRQPVPEVPVSAAAPEYSSYVDYYSQPYEQQQPLKAGESSHSATYYQHYYQNLPSQSAPISQPDTQAQYYQPAFQHYGQPYSLQHPQRQHYVHRNYAPYYTRSPSHPNVHEGPDTS